MTRSLQVVLAAALVAIGVAIGYSLHGGSPQSAADSRTGSAATSQRVWTCSMHPQVRLDRPGKCPICAMPLIQAGGEQRATGGAPLLQLSEHAVAMASVDTAPVERRELSRELRTVGKVEFNESSLATITPRVDGYAERLFVNFTGVAIKKGDHLAEVYSPELLVAQQELLIASQAEHSGPLVETAKTKLRLLGLTEAQVANLVEKREITERITLYSPIDGTVIEKLVVDKAAFKAGEPLYRIANLESVWVYVDVYEYDLPWIRFGQKVSITAEAVPGAPFEGMVTFVQPTVNDLTRTIRVPVHVVNSNQKLKPGMFVSVVVHVALGPDGEARPTGLEGKYSCPMHPQVVRDAKGPCPICEMPLETVPGAPSGATPAARGLAIPVTAVLDSGTRRLVYVEKAKGLFEPREIVIGPRSGTYYSVSKGLDEGERVVVRGNFFIDSQFQLQGQPSLLYPGGLHASMGHQHGGDGATNPPKQPAPATPDEHAGHKR